MVLDEKDLELLDNRIDARQSLKGPLVGDWCIMPDGTHRRFTHDWGDSIQTTVGAAHPCNGDASFYLYKEGGASFSGSLDSAIDKARITPTDETKPGSFWFFHHDYMTAHNGVHVTVDCTVWTVQP